jgi:hypothetical protein
VNALGQPRKSLVFPIVVVALAALSIALPLAHGAPVGWRDGLMAAVFLLIAVYRGCLPVARGGEPVEPGRRPAWVRSIFGDAGRGTALIILAVCAGWVAGGFVLAAVDWESHGLWMLLAFTGGQVADMVWSAIRWLDRHAGWHTEPASP